MKVHRVIIMVVDHDSIGADAVSTELENARYGNDCMMPRVESIETLEVNWSDEHPLNQPGWAEAFERLFARKK